ncbi:hypothetical protein LCGC14_0945460 [marine sediment metagenome]|uniref:Uncharacterized protein n=1 Tax=marine sediment metagenome TaxID=412755 RepID=A0A0F9NNK6_9ZZZZ
MNLISLVTLIFPPPTNATTLLQKLQYFDSLTDVGFGGVLGIVFSIIIFGSLFLTMKAFAMEKALAVSLFISSVLMILFAGMGFISSNIIYIAITAFVASIFLLINRESQGGF